MKRNRSFLLAAAVAATILAAVPADAENWVPVTTTGSSISIEKPTRFNQLPPFGQQIFLPDQNRDVKITTKIAPFPVDPQLFGIGNAKKGRVKVQMSCLTPNGQRNLGTKKVRADPGTGTMVFTRVVPSTLNCDLFFLDFEWLRNLKLPAGTSIEIDTAVELIEPGAAASCVDKNTLCLRDDRFQVEVEWRDFPVGSGGPGIAFPNTDDSGTFFFFDANNSELLIKVLDGCDFNNHFWVFYAATTDVEFNLTVTDTQTTQTHVYGNPLGQAAPAILDTQAFATCP